MARCLACGTTRREIGEDAHDRLRPATPPATAFHQEDFQAIDRFVQLTRSNPVALMNVLQIRLSQQELAGLAFAVDQRAKNVGGDRGSPA